MTKINQVLINHRPGIRKRQSINTYAVRATAETRGLSRQALKNEQGNNHIRDAWRRLQVAKHPELAHLYLLLSAARGGKRRRLLDKISRGCAV